MKYVCLIYVPTDFDPTRAQADAITAEYDSFTRTITERSIMAGSLRLADASVATTVRRRAGQRLLSDGPFTETKEVLAGLFIIECKDLDEALDYAGAIPTAAYGSIEVRPLVDG